MGPIDLSRSRAKAARSGKYVKLPRITDDEIVYRYARGYWLTRYLLDEHGELLKDLLAKRHKPRALDDKLAAALGTTREQLWPNIDSVVLAHFRPRQTTADLPALKPVDDE